MKFRIEFETDGHSFSDRGEEACFEHIFARIIRDRKPQMLGDKPITQKEGAIRDPAGYPIGYWIESDDL